MKSKMVPERDPVGARQRLELNPVSVSRRERRADDALCVVWEYVSTCCDGQVMVEELEGALEQTGFGVCLLKPASNADFKAQNRLTCKNSGSDGGDSETEASRLAAGTPMKCHKT
jgi:hypothetical protein